jgi:phosphonate transport system substrate-binding protein
MKVFKMLALLLAMSMAFVSCEDPNAGPIVMVWYPNESGEDLEAARDAFGEVIKEATGRDVELQLTTDYAIAIETIANGNAHIGWQGAQGYIQTHNKNDKVLPMFVPSGKSGTLDDAVYYSWLAVKKGNEGQYQDGESYKIDNIQGQRFSFVSNSSTSGFKVPSAGITSYFSKMDAWSDLEQTDLLEGGDDKFFAEVLYGGSHQGSAVNLITGKVDVAAFCDVCVQNYVELVSGTANRPAAVYRVLDDAAAPFDDLAGEEVFLISVTPVLNAPFVYNSEVLPADQMEAIVAAFTSEEVANNERIFVPSGSEFTGLFRKGSDEMGFVTVEDSWFQPIRDLSN